METTRILVIGPLPPCIGGDSVFTMNLAASGYWREAGIDVATINSTSTDRIRMAGDPYRARDAVRFLRIMRELARKLPRSRFVIICANTSFLLTAGLVLMGILAASRKRFVVKMFGTSLAEGIDAAGSIRKRIAVRLLHRAAYLLPETDGFARTLSSATGIPVDRMRRLPNFIRDADIGRSRGNPRFDGRCVFVGQVKREKGVFTIADALAGRRDLSCDLYGPIVDRDRAEFMDRLSSSGNVRYGGILAPADVVSAIARYDALLLPTFHAGEGHPAVILQAFAAGVPVVASRWKYIPEIVPDRKRGVLVPPGSPDALLAAIDLLASDDALRRSIVHNANAYVDAFSERRVVGDMLFGFVGVESTAGT